PSGPTEFARPSEQGGERLAQETHSITAQTRLHRDGERRAQRPPGPVTPPPAASGTTADAPLRRPPAERMLAQETPSTPPQTRLHPHGDRRPQRPPGPTPRPPAPTSSPTESARPSEPGEQLLAQETPSTAAQTRLHRDGERRAQRPPGPVTPPPAASGTTDSARLSKPTAERMLAQETPSTAAPTRLQRHGERPVHPERAP